LVAGQLTDPFEFLAISEPFLNLWMSDAQDWCFLCIALFIVAIPIIGIVCTAIGAVRYATMGRTPWLVSLPLCPTGSFPYQTYIGNWPGLGVCQNFNPNLRVPLPYDMIKEPAVEQKAFLIHNLWNYQISGSLRAQSSTGGFTFSLSRNRILSSSFSSNGVDIAKSDFIDGGFFGPDDRVKIYCPNVTVSIDGQHPSCDRSRGDFAFLTSRYEKVELGEVNYDDISGGGSLEFVFSALSAVPTDFLDPPQLYWLSFGRVGMNAILITGIVFASITVATIVLAICCKCCDCC
jgi:hypothetical protein